MDLKPKKLNRMPDSKCIWLRRAYWIQAGHSTEYCNLCELGLWNDGVKCCSRGCRSYHKEKDNGPH